MKVTANITELGQAMTWVGRAISPRPLSPVMSGMKIVAADDQLTIMGSDYDKSHTATVRAEVAHDGIILVSGRLTRELVSALPGERVELITDDDTAVTIRAGRSTYKVPLIPLEEYPNLPDFPTTMGTTHADQLVRLGKTVKHAIDEASPHAFLHGIRLEGTNEGLLGAGTNRFIISSVTIPWENYTDDFECQVPVAVYETATGGLTGEVTVGYRDGIIGFRDSTREVTARTIGSDYGDWRAGLRFLKDMRSVVVDTHELTSAIKRAGLTCPPEAPVWLTVAPDHIEVTAGSTDTADGTELVDATGEAEIQTAFAPKYLTDTLATVTTDQVDIAFTENPKYPARIIPVGDDSALHVLMPRMGNNRAK